MNSPAEASVAAVAAVARRRVRSHCPRGDDAPAERPGYRQNLWQAGRHRAAYGKVHTSTSPLPAG
ncbi:hypothetical protein, partial [Limnohabitans sp. Rim8]|uniref:hypothetical protein n=1 Tax=Limnohabitans sp. Rim8 TaxID=1100718 RepID=UPI00261287E3